MRWFGHLNRINDEQSVEEMVWKARKIKLVKEAEVAEESLGEFRRETLNIEKRRRRNHKKGS